MMHSDGFAVVVWLPMDVVRCLLPERLRGESNDALAGTVVGEAGQQLRSPGKPLLRSAYGST